MTEKSHVGIGAHICPVCTKRHDEVVLIDKRLKETLTKDEMVGFKLCEEHLKLKEDDYIALVGIDENKSMQPFDIATVYRTGMIAHLKRETYLQIIDKDLPTNPFNIAVCSDEVIKKLAAIPTE